MSLWGLAAKGPHDLLSPAGLGTKRPPEYVSALPRDPDGVPSGFLEEEYDLYGLKEV